MTEPTIQMTMTQLRMFIAEAVAQAIPSGRQTKEALSSGEKRKAVTFEREGLLDQVQDLEASRSPLRSEGGMESRGRRGKMREDVAMFGPRYLRRRS